MFRTEHSVYNPINHIIMQYKILKEYPKNGLTIIRIIDSATDKKYWKIKEYGDMYFKNFKTASKWVSRFKQAKLFE